MLEDSYQFSGGHPIRLASRPVFIHLFLQRCQKILHSRELPHFLDALRKLPKSGARLGGQERLRLVAFAQRTFFLVQSNESNSLFASTARHRNSAKMNSRGGSLLCWGWFRS